MRNVSHLKILVYEIENEKKFPVPDRLQPLLDMSPPVNQKKLKRIILLCM